MADRAALEMPCTFAGTAGSNPALSVSPQNRCLPNGVASQLVNRVKLSLWQPAYPEQAETQVRLDPAHCCQSH